MPDLYNCWHCGKSLHGIEMAEDVDDVPFFHCDKICQSKCKLWNSKPKDHGGYDKSENGQVVYVDDSYGDPDFECVHKRNCKAHREICIAKHGYDKI